MSFTTAQINYLEANRNSIEARRTFQIAFASGTVRLIEGSTPWSDGAHEWQPAHAVIRAGGIRASGLMDAHPAVYTFGAVTAALASAHLGNEAEWRDAVVHQRLVLFVDGSAVGPAIHIHRGRIQNIRRRRNVTTDDFEVTVEGPFRDRNVTPLGKYTDRDQQMRRPGDRGCEYAAQYEISGAELQGWLQT